MVATFKVGVHIGKKKYLKMVTSKKILFFNSTANKSIAGQRFFEFLGKMFPECTDFLKTDIGCTISSRRRLLTPFF